MNAKEVVEEYLSKNNTTLSYFNGPIHAAIQIRRWGYHWGIMGEPTYDHFDNEFLDLYVYLNTGVIP